MHNMPNDNMQNNMQINMQNMLAICRFGSDCLVLTVICRICQIICSICPICYDDFQYAQYALPTLLMYDPLSGTVTVQPGSLSVRQRTRTGKPSLSSSSGSEAGGLGDSDSSRQ